MEIQKNDIDGLLLIKPKVFGDNRGYFFESFNKKKFRFAEDEVEYVGFKVTKYYIALAESMTESIRNFPKPKNITDARGVLWPCGVSEF